MEWNGMEWNHGMESWNHGIMESWNHGIMESWNHGIMESWNHGIMESWNGKESKYQRIEKEYA